ncbi:MAG TPA: hypothetical protein VGK20_11535 [Candidatus Binatia bacterium]|jgi:hypothetical protein
MLSRSGTLAIGLLLFALPFFQSGLGESGAHSTSCSMDHEPHHGGTVAMAGNVHVEVVENDRHVELFVTDLDRRPLEPVAASVSFDDSPATPLSWESSRMVASRPDAYRWATYRVDTGNGDPVAVRLPAGPFAAAH